MKKLTPSSELEVAAWLRKRGYDYCPEALNKITKQLANSHSKMTTEMPMEQYLEGVEYAVNMCTTQ